MTPEQHSQAKEVFVQASRLPEEKRRAFVDEATGGDAEVQREVESLLGFHEEDTLTFSEPQEELDFPAGRLLADRYRIIERLGKGGMGVVFRADDLMTGEQLALKFLNANSEALKERLIDELRLARQVTHAHVCRAYDLIELEGRLCISMEFVEGEDLTSLLTRIGRLPQDRAVELSVQLLKGLAAAHAKGVIHRDLKPSNIMIDEQGNARITDFGISSDSKSSQRRLSSAGTPAYMAPEQLARRGTSEQSDLYSLGLVIYEMCTGAYPFEARTLQEYIQAHRFEEPPPPTSFVEGLDPRLERVILNCLAKDPNERPTSALAVAAALTGRDVLELASDLGTTPSPEMVADAGSQGLLTARMAVILGGLLGALLLAVLLTSDRARRLPSAGLVLPPEVLAEKARDKLRQFGYDEEPFDEAFGFLENDAALSTVEAGGHVPDPSAPGSSSILFWYRNSPNVMISTTTLPFQTGEIAPKEPPLSSPGMSLVMLHPKGTLDHLEYHPDTGEDSEYIETDFSQLLNAAGLEPATFKPTASFFAPSFFADSRAAFIGSSEQRRDFDLLIKTAGFQGRPVFFRMVPASEEESKQADDAEIPLPATPDAEAAGQAPGETALGETALGETALGETAPDEEAESSLMLTLIDSWYAVYDLVFIIAALASLFIARINLRRGRGDRRGAWQLAIALCGLSLVAWLLQGPHYRNITVELNQFTLRFGSALAESTFVWLFYLALEPEVRRVWPHTLIAWSRLFQGRFRDPLVGRSLLIGAVAGTTWALFAHLNLLLPDWLGLSYQPLPVESLQFDLALRPGVTLASVSFLLHRGIYDAVYSLMILVLMRLLFRQPWLAVVAYTALFTLLYQFDGVHPGIGIAVGLAMAATEALTMHKFGLVTMATAVFVFSILRYLPVTAQFSTWYSSAGLLAIGLTALIAAVGAYHALEMHQRPIARYGSSRARSDHFT